MPVESNGDVDRHGDLSKTQAALKILDVSATLESSQKYYNELWSETYDADVLGVGHAGARALARVLEHVVTNKLGIDRPQNLHILDVGCGTCMVGDELRARGFTNVDGLDASPKMLEKARQKGVYGKLYEAFVTGDKPVVDVKPETYDIVTACGAFIHAHIPAKGLRQILKLVNRNSGLLVVCGRLKPKNDSEHQYLDEMAQLQENMLKEDLVEIVHDEEVEKYVNYNGWENGRAVVFRRLN